MKEIITAIAGIIVAVAVIVGLIYLLVKKKKRKTPQGPEIHPPSEPPTV